MRIFTPVKKGASILAFLFSLCLFMPTAQGHQKVLKGTPFVSLSPKNKQTLSTLPVKATKHVSGDTLRQKKKIKLKGHEPVSYCIAPENKNPYRLRSKSCTPVLARFTSCTFHRGHTERGPPSFSL